MTLIVPLFVCLSLGIGAIFGYKAGASQRDRLKADKIVTKENNGKYTAFFESDPTVTATEFSREKAVVSLLQKIESLD